MRDDLAALIAEGYPATGTPSDTEAEAAVWAAADAGDHEAALQLAFQLCAFRAFCWRPILGDDPRADTAPKPLTGGMLDVLGNPGTTG